MHTPEALQTARLAALEGTMLALMREAVQDGFDGLSVIAEVTEGQVSIDLSYTKAGMPMTGHSL